LKKITVLQMATAGILGGLSMVLGLVPAVGFIPVPTPAGSATTMHIPAILGGIIGGPVVGALVGLVFGTFSFVRSTSPLFKDPLIAFGPRILIGVVAYYAFVAAKHKVTRPLVTGILGLTIARLTYEMVGTFNANYAKSAGPSAAATSFHQLTAQTWFAWTSAIVLGALVAAFVYGVARRDNAAPALAAIAGTLTNTVGVLGLISWRFHWPAKAAVLVGLTHGLPEMLVAVILVVPIYRAVRLAVPRAFE